jgi:beta-glucosidase
MKLRLALPLAFLAALVAVPASSQQDAPNDPDARAAAIVAQMTLEEKVRILHGHYPNRMEVRPDGVPMSAGYVPPIERLGIPAQRMTDASLGVAAAHQFDNPATALPSGLAQAATFDPRIAFAGGATIGREAREKGFNVMLAGGANLVREPRNGRNFEYLGEDALLAGIMGGEAVRGIQSNRIVSTVKHFALNAQETGRHVLDAQIDEAALRESDLLAFQKQIEISDPGAIMCAYNRVNGHYAC